MASKVFVLAGLLALLLALPAMAVKKEPRTKGPSKKVWAGQCKIGVIGPTSGENEAFGEAMVNGANMAIDEFAGVLKVKASVKQYDSGCNKANSPGQLEKAHMDGMVAIIGDACSGSTLAMDAGATMYKMPIVSPGATSPRLTTEAGPYIYRVVPSDVLQGKVLAETAVEAKHMKVGIIHDNDAYGEGLAHETFVAISKLGGSVVGMLGFYNISVWKAGQLGGLLSEKPDAIVIATNAGASVYAAAAKEARNLGFTGQFYGGDTTGGATPADKTLLAALVGIQSISLNMGTADFKAKYAKKYGEEPFQTAAQAYDAARAILLACRSGPGPALKAALDKTNFEGATGKVAFDSVGDAITTKYDFVEMDKDGVWKLVV